jgi:hypothetical protein
MKIKWEEGMQRSRAMKARTRRLLLAALTVMLVVSSGAAPVVAQSDSPHIAQQSDKTTPTLTPTAEKCDPSDAPQMETAWLFAREDTITTGQAGVIAGGFLPPAELQCDMVVRVTMQVPNNMYIEGTHTLSSGSAGIVSSEFTIPAGTSSVESVRAKVYASETSELSVTVGVRYYPEGYPDLQRSLPELTLNFDFQESRGGPYTVANSGSSNDDTGTPQLDGSDSGSSILEFFDPLTLVILGLSFISASVAISYWRGRGPYINT